MPIDFNSTENDDDEVTPDQSEELSHAYPGGLVPMPDRHEGQIYNRDVLMLLIVGGIAILATAICGTATGVL